MFEKSKEKQFGVGGRVCSSGISRSYSQNGDDCGRIGGQYGDVGTTFSGSRSQNGDDCGRNGGQYGGVGITFSGSHSQNGDDCGRIGGQYGGIRTPSICTN